MPDRGERPVNSTDEGRTGWRQVFLCLILITIGVGAGYFYWPHFSTVPLGVYARLDTVGRESAKRLVAEPCNQTIAESLVQSLMADADYATLINVSTAIGKQCGPNEDLLQPVFQAQVRTANLAEAEKTSDLLISQYRADPSAFAWRAKVREKRGNYEGAYLDYLSGLLLFSDPSNVAASVYYDIARTASKAGHPCDAAFVMRDYIAFAPEQRRTQQITTLIRGWETEGRCPSSAGTGTAHIRFDSTAPAIVVPVKVNGVLGYMILDTGATRTVVGSEFARKVGINKFALEISVVSTANGHAFVAAGRADEIALGDSRLNDVPIFVQDLSFGEKIDGLLGLSYLGNFHITIADGAVDLRPLK